MNNYYIYIISNSNNTVLYIGVTSDLPGRIYQHKNKLIDGFSKKFNLNKLVYYEKFEDINEAIKREKQLKKWKRSWKDELLDKTNINRNDLYESLF